MSEPSGAGEDPEASKQRDVERVFAQLSDDLGDLNLQESLDDSSEDEELMTSEEYYGEVESRPLQFQLRALFAALLLTGFFSLAYLYQRAFGFFLFFTVAAFMASRAKMKRERMVATMFFGGAALLCGGLMMAESSRPAIALMGLILSCLGGYASLHGVALVIASFWE